MILEKKTLEYVAELARIKLDPAREEKLLKDLERILEYFEELKNVNTDGVPSMTGGTLLKNVYREDDPEKNNLPNASALNAFPEKKGNLLKIPPVFTD